MAHVAAGDYEMVGTFNGNPLALAAARAMLTEVATPEAYQRIDALAGPGPRRASSARSPRPGLAAHVVTAGAKGCVVFSAQPVRDYRGFLGVDDRYSHAHWLFQHNGGVFLPPWGKIEQWLISVQHDEPDIDRLVENFGVFARAVSACGDRRLRCAPWRGCRRRARGGGHPKVRFAGKPCAPGRRKSTCY